MAHKKPGTAVKPARKRKAPPRAWKPGQSGNPAGSSKQIFGTRDPFKQAVVRVALIEQDLTLSPAQKIREKALTLDKAARRLMKSACDDKGSLRAIEILRDTLDGKPQASDPPAQINTFNLVVNSMRALNLTEEQLDALIRDSETINAGAGGVIPQT